MTVFMSEVVLNFSEFCSLHGRDGIKPATDDGASVGKPSRNISPGCYQSKRQKTRKMPI
jgi:hypothetical protein